ncbi:hypothetical protein ACM757_29630, partial [Pseudomonas aeruginosa]
GVQGAAPVFRKENAIKKQSFAHVAELAELIVRIGAEWIPVSTRPLNQAGHAIATTALVVV